MLARIKKLWNKSTRTSNIDKNYKIFCCLIAVVLVDISEGIVYCISLFDHTLTLYVITYILYFMGEVVSVSTIYFSFEFGHTAYLKVYGRIHSCCYRKITTRYKKTNMKDYVELEKE